MLFTTPYIGYSFCAVCFVHLHAEAQANRKAAAFAAVSDCRDAKQIEFGSRRGSQPASPDSR